MIRRKKKVPVYTIDSVIIYGDDHKKQEVIDKWTDELATKMARMLSDNALVDEFDLDIEVKEHRGGHNRKTIEMLNGDGYLVRVFHSIDEAATCLGVSHDMVGRIARGVKKSPFVDSTLRFRETDKESKARMKAKKKKTKNTK